MHRQDDAPEGGQVLQPQAPGFVGAQNDGRALRLAEDHQRVTPLRQWHGQGREDIQRRVEVRRELRQQAPEIALAAHPRRPNAGRRACDRTSRRPSVGLLVATGRRGHRRADGGYSSRGGWRRAAGAANLPAAVKTGDGMQRKILDIAEMKELARRRVPKMFFDYADCGAWTESTYRANEEDFAKIKLRQRVLVDMTNRSLETTMIGEKVSMPVALAPTGSDRHAACRRRDAGGAGGRRIRRAVHAVDHEHLLDRGCRVGNDEAVLVPALRHARQGFRRST